jgi:hypothetical protein
MEAVSRKAKKLQPDEHCMPLGLGKWLASRIGDWRTKAPEARLEQLVDAVLTAGLQTTSFKKCQVSSIRPSMQLAPVVAAWDDARAKEAVLPLDSVAVNRQRRRGYVPRCSRRQRRLYAERPSGARSQLECEAASVVCSAAQRCVALTRQTQPGRGDAESEMRNQPDRSDRCTDRRKCSSVAC